MPGVHIKTYGCRMNERAPAGVAPQLAARVWALEGALDSALVNGRAVIPSHPRRGEGGSHGTAGDLFPGLSPVLGIHEQAH